MKGFLGKFLGKKKEPEETPKEDGFQAAPAEALQESVPSRLAPAVAADAEQKYDNEILLRGRIGLSTGASKPEAKKAEDKPEDKPDEEAKEEPEHDTLESEYAQQMRLKINKEFDENGG